MACMFIFWLWRCQGSRVIMKMDISHTDHSYIIGRQGNIIKRIMETTATHIHFPDSNRSPNSTEKSNQVSLCGSLEGVEKARAQVRVSQPRKKLFVCLIFKNFFALFSLQHRWSFHLSYQSCRLVEWYQTVTRNTSRMSKTSLTFRYAYRLSFYFAIIFHIIFLVSFIWQVIFSTRVKLHSSLVLVKGSEKEAARVQEATQLLINFMCDNIAVSCLLFSLLSLLLMRVCERYFCN